MIHATAAAFTVGALLDLFFGDPRWLPHPIRGMGLLVQGLEWLFRPAVAAVYGDVNQMSRRFGLAHSPPCITPRRGICRSHTFRHFIHSSHNRRQSGGYGIAGGPQSASATARSLNYRPPLQYPLGEKIAGCILVGVVLLIVVAVVIFSLHWGGMPAAAYWIFTCLAVRSLDQESNTVVEALRADDLHRARKLVARLVGRDTQGLSQKEVTRAVFETVAENMSDAIVAPLFYLALFGVPGMVAYKAVNTMDSMIGYKNERYIRFGWAAARLDDIANYVPARITAGLIVFSAALIRLEWRRAITVVFRDAHLQPSPNAGYPEAALAGALGVQLGGLNYYFGRPVEKPFLGDAREDLNWSQFSQVRLLLYLVAAMSYLVVGLWLL